MSQKTNLFRWGWSILLLLPLWSFSQQDSIRSREGWYMSPYGRLHILLVFAEIDFDSSWANLEPLDREGTHEWKRGRLPKWKDRIISVSPDGDGYITEYFRQASFGEFQVTGDFIDTILTIPLSSVRDNRGNVILREPYATTWYRNAVRRTIDQADSSDFAYGSRRQDFDHWTYTSSGIPNVFEPDGSYDMVMIVWRNIHVAGLGNQSGFVQHGSIGKVWGSESNMYSMFRTQAYLPKTIMRHEFSHMLYGGNNFHTAAGGVGRRTFMSSVGGWSNMSGDGLCSPVWNGWDRQRMGWKHPDKEYLVSAICAETRQEVPTDFLKREHPCEGKEYILRDFVETGDVIRIQIPHVDPGADPQFLWLENHQMREGNIDHEIEKALVPGLYAYMQVGKEERKGKHVFGGNNNYIYPLPAVGSYDFRFDVNERIMYRDSDKENPFTGYHYLMYYAWDTNGDGQIQLTTNINPKTEMFFPKELYIDGKIPDDDYFSYKHYAIFGTPDVAFRTDGISKLGLSYPTAATPLYSFSSPGGPAPTDNRKIYLNGLSVEVVEMYPNGNLRVRVEFNDYEIARDVRWCGDIVSMEEIHVNRGKTIRLSQGIMPTVPYVVQEIDGEPLFAYPTRLVLEPDSELELEAGAELRVEKGSSLVIRKGAEVDLGRRAKIVIEPGAYLEIEDGVDVDTKCGAKIVREEGSLEGHNPLLDVGPKGGRPHQRGR